MNLLVLADVASSTLVLGAAFVLAVYYWRWWRTAPPSPDRTDVMPWVIVAFSLYIAERTIVPAVTTLTTEAQRTWRVPLNVAANLVVSALIYLVCRAVAERRERERDR